MATNWSNKKHKTWWFAQSLTKTESLFMKLKGKLKTKLHQRKEDLWPISSIFMCKLPYCTQVIVVKDELGCIMQLCHLLISHICRLNTWIPVLWLYISHVAVCHACKWTRAISNLLKQLLNWPSQILTELKLVLHHKIPTTKMFLVNCQKCFNIWHCTLLVCSKLHYLHHTLKFHQTLHTWTK